MEGVKHYTKNFFFFCGLFQWLCFSLLFFYVDKQDKQYMGSYIQSSSIGLEFLLNKKIKSVLSTVLRIFPRVSSPDKNLLQNQHIESAKYSTLYLKSEYKNIPTARQLRREHHLGFHSPLVGVWDYGKFGCCYYLAPF